MTQNICQRRSTEYEDGLGMGMGMGMGRGPNLRKQRKPRFDDFYKLPGDPTSENNANLVLVISTSCRSTQPPKTTQTSFW